MKKSILFLPLIFLPHVSFSEDIELYIGDTSLRAETKPQVLLIVDTSGSMGDTETIKTLYDPDRTYKVQGGFPGRGNDYLYYVVGESDSLPTVDDNNENRRFLASINNCSTAVSRLNKVGFYTGRIREYTFEGNTGSWEELPEADGTSISIIDCEDDITLDLSNIDNGTPIEHNSNSVSGSQVTGYPIDGAGNSSSPIYYADDINTINSSWGGDVVTVYTDNYLRWQQGTQYSDNTNIGTENISRIDIARETLVNLIDSIPSVQFGLQVYNRNNSHNNSDQSQKHGGRVVFGVQEMTVSAKDSLFGIIEDDIYANGWTPLCESYYEAYRYFAGLSVFYGNNDNNRVPPRDTSIESGGNYIAPYTGCTNEIFVILITDGVPTRDGAADTRVLSLQASSSSASTATPIDGNYLPVLAEYMQTNDINDDMDGTQIATLYTIGFSSGADDAEEVLTAAASKGGGQYYKADDPTKLGSSLQKALSSILEVSSSFTAPSVATNSFDRTETQDSAYYGMFIPESGAKWKGNLKKLKLVDNVQVDKNGDSAIDAQGNMLASAVTYWNNTAQPDGNDVEAGGVVGMFNDMTTPRKVYSDIGASNILSDLTYTSMVNYYGGNQDVLTAFGLSDIAEAAKYLNWSLGFDVDDADGDNSTTDYRPDLFGDPLHSKPVAINYGGSAATPDIRIVVGTNSGVLHMFKDEGNTVEESWAFMPKQFFSDIKSLRDNLPAAEKVYGVDGSITSFTLDLNGDGTISGTGEKAWIFFGLRRGGSSYYGIDVTNPDAPKYLWEIKADNGDFKELAQTWSQPQVAYSKINFGSDGSPKPVLIFGAGYSVSKDASGPGTNDDVGRGIYMVDAETGSLLWSVTPEAQNTKNTQYTGFTDSIPSRITLLDSDSDGFVDRLYTGDTGGNVFRVDMPGNEPFSVETPWTIFKFAELGGTTNENDRRFFNEPTIARTFFTDTVESTVDGTTSVTQKETPYDAILIGSGDRSTPTATDTADKFFMLQDENIITQSFVVGAQAPALEPPLPILFNDTYLHDFTDNPYESITGTAKQALDLIVSQKSGWYFNYEMGERSTASALIIEGTAFFTSFAPGNIAETSSCSLSTGNGFIYAIDLFDGTTAYDSRKTAITSTLPDTPTIVIPPTGIVTTQPDENAPPGTDSSNILILTGGVPIETDVSLSTFNTYQYITE